MQPDKGPGLYLCTGILGASAFLHWDGEKWTNPASGHGIKPESIATVGEGPYVPLAHGFDALLHDGVAEAMNFPSIAWRLTSLETKMRFALGNDDAFHNRIANLEDEIHIQIGRRLGALERHSHEPQEIEPRVIRALIKLGVIVRREPRGWFLCGSARSLDHIDLINAQIGVPDDADSPCGGAFERQESLHDGEFPPPPQTDRAGEIDDDPIVVERRNGEEWHATPQAAADAWVKSNVRPLGVIPIPDWLAAAIKKAGADPVSIHIAAGPDRGADYIPPRPGYDAKVRPIASEHVSVQERGDNPETKIITFTGIPKMPGFRFAVGERVKWTDRKERRYFGFWRVKACHVDVFGKPYYELEGTSRRVDEADLEPALSAKDEQMNRIFAAGPSPEIDRLWAKKLRGDYSGRSRLVVGLTVNADTQETVWYEFDGAEMDTLNCLFVHGPTWDGNIPSKAARSELIKHGLAFHAGGFASLTELGVRVCCAADVTGWRDQRWNDKKNGDRLKVQRDRPGPLV